MMIYMTSYEDHEDRGGEGEGGGEGREKKKGKGGKRKRKGKERKEEEGKGRKGRKREDIIHFSIFSKIHKKRGYFDLIKKMKKGEGREGIEGGAIPQDRRRRPKKIIIGIKLTNTMLTGVSDLIQE